VGLAAVTVALQTPCGPRAFAVSLAATTVGFETRRGPGIEGIAGRRRPMGKRLFVSVDLPDDLADDVAAVQEAFRDASGLNFTDPGQAHVTVKFLGDTPPRKADPLCETLAEAAAVADVYPFEATYGGLGVFPSLDYISVVWLGVDEGAEEMVRLHEAVEERTTAMGFDEEDHEFTPHVTLARMDHAGGKELVQELVRERDPTVGTTRVEALRLTESELGPDGPEYSTVERFPLAPE
jgi:2'-5' RNA ligase